MVGFVKDRLSGTMVIDDVSVAVHIVGYQAHGRRQTQLTRVRTCILKNEFRPQPLGYKDQEDSARHIRIQCNGMLHPVSRAVEQAEQLGRQLQLRTMHSISRHGVTVYGFKFS